jgi:hypothetical protein
MIAGPDPLAADVPSPPEGAGTRHEAAIVAVKTLHTGIFLAVLAAIGWIVLTGLIGRRDRTVVAAAGVVAAEAAVFIANGGVCPLTPFAERLGSDSGAVTDIFLPRALARSIPIWSTALVVGGLLLHARSARTRGRIRAASLR